MKFSSVFQNIFKCFNFEFIITDVLKDRTNNGYINSTVKEMNKQIPY